MTGRRVVAAILLAMLAAPSILAAPPHEDYSRVPEDDDTVRRAGQILLDLSVEGVQMWRLDRVNDTLETADEIKELSERLDILGDRANEDPEYPKLLILLGPPSRDLGAAMDDILRMGVALDHHAGSREDLQRYKDLLPARHRHALEALDTFDELDYDTQLLRDLLAERVATYEDYVIPEDPGSDLSAQEQEDLSAGGSSLVRGGDGVATGGTAANRRFAWVEPATAWFGQDFEVRVFAPGDAGGTVTIQAHDLEWTRTLDPQGHAEVTTPVPWTASLGANTIRVTFKDESLRMNQEVVQVLTRFENGIVRTPITRIHLMDGNDDPVHPATVQWQSGTEDGDAETDPEGFLRFEVPDPGDQAITLHYEGNRTHAEASFIAPPPSLPTEGNGAPGAGPEDLFAEVIVVRGGGVTDPLDDRDFTQFIAWTILGILGLFVLGEVALSLRPGKPVQGLVQFRVRPPLVLVPLAGLDLHPLLTLLAREGRPVQAMTLREAGQAWAAMDAPELMDWLPEHERTYYAGLQKPRMPRRLLDWAKDRL